MICKSDHIQRLRPSVGQTDRQTLTDDDIDACSAKLSSGRCNRRTATDKTRKTTAATAAAAGASI